MKKVVLILAVAIGLAACNSENKQTSANSEYDSFGAVITPDSAIDATTLIAEMGNAPTYDAKIKGTVVDVCQKKGCWMNVELGNGEVMKVVFKDYAFFVPTDKAKIVGREVIMQGTAKFETISVEDQKHYMEDGKESQEKIDAITEPKYELNFEAVGVLVPKAAPAVTQATASVN